MTSRTGAKGSGTLPCNDYLAYGRKILMENNISNISGSFLGAIKEVTKRPAVPETPADELADIADVESEPDQPLIEALSESSAEASDEISGEASDESADALHAPSQNDALAYLQAKQGAANEADHPAAADPSNTAEQIIALSEDSSNESLETSIAELQLLLKHRLMPGRSANRDTAAQPSPVEQQADEKTSINDGEQGLIDHLVGTLLHELESGEVDTTSLVEEVRPQIVRSLGNAPVDKITKPDIAIIGPIFEILLYAGHKPSIVALCANLIATAMNSETARFAHPGFIEVIRNLTADEARIIEHLTRVRVIPVIDIKKVMLEKHSEQRLNSLVSTIGADANCEHHDLAESYLANLERIGVLEVPRDVYLTDANIYDRVLNAPPVKEKLTKLNTVGNAYRGEVVQYYAKLSIYGLQFSKACITAGKKIADSR